MNSPLPLRPVSAFTAAVQLCHVVASYGGGGNIDSYMLGDRNSDGVNDLADWVLIRQDFLAAGQGALLARVSLAAPEPCAATMAASSSD